MSTIYRPLAAAILIYGCSASGVTLANENLIQNGSFEQFTTVKKINRKVRMVNFDHWQQTGQSWSNKKGITATNGYYKAHLDAAKNTVNTLSQTVTTIPGQKYVLSLDAYRPYTVTAADFEVLVDDTVLLNTTPDSGWRRHSASFIGTGGTQTITLQEIAAQDSGSGALIDNVSLVADQHSEERYSDDRSDAEKQAHNLLLQASFGPTTASLQAVAEQGIEGWVDAQLNAPSAYDQLGDGQLTYLERYIQIAKQADPERWPDSYDDYTREGGSLFTTAAPGKDSAVLFPNIWFENALHAEDQLRQRVAYALSQILVVNGSSQASAYYYDLLAEHAFGNYRDLLVAVSRSPKMCDYLTFCGSKGNKDWHQPDENYARELMQLFTLGLKELNMDGTPKLDALNNEIPSYTQNDVEELAKVFTGWDRHGDSKYGKFYWENSDLVRPTRFNSWFHNKDEKTLLGQTIPAGMDGHDEVVAAIDILMSHPSIAPFISKHLIMRLVTSNPSPAYVERVATIFHSTQGDLKAVVRAILLDSEARDSHTQTAYFGKAKESVLALTQFLRSFDASHSPNPFVAWKMGFGTSTMMDNVYLFRTDFRSKLGQAPLDSPTVFNFYSPDFVPNDPNFQLNNQVAPELEIQSEQVATHFANLLHLYLSNYEYNTLLAKPDENPNDWIAVSLDEEVAVVLSVLDGDFANLDQHHYRVNALNKLINHLDIKLTNGHLSSEQRNLLRDYALNLPYSPDTKGARKMASELARLIIATGAYATQR